MKITINGQPFETAEQNTLANVLIEFDAKEPFAVALNGDFVPRSQVQATVLKQDDSVELLSPIQGG
ncbi:MULTISPECIES: sulfur carrier protein ThiS [unclassified Pseudoalteromonas]|uniref:sulfur carrier protein ThiS n=1 Tax=unclassified Pseudoalteromonas TaxID=194690 RepID=UPI000C0885E8|nr:MULTISPECIES: sulfur carrier protein ThiS [unclassified Pseudoalteromonas]MDP2635814.1 sulfur carrier protein ThiS [Pseudoalteromonas sp. 1_MG-2023]PHN88129.1 thiamine biosynthesis protein ThiS [Pseudoalteromonas sp. 3D05]TGE83626.1 thiamine biosynthesis protein ThiS [Pseudoalteromonas sp. KS88]